MRLEQRISGYEEYMCDLTKELDNISNISKKHYYDMFHHYILADDWCKNQKCLVIRVPGRTIGGVWIDDDNVITKVAVEVNYRVITYPSNVSELMQKYIGEVIEYHIE